MSGHSHWATIKHKKGKEDARKGKIFSKMARLIEVAARTGGADIDHNPKLRGAIEKARASEMPKENIERAIKKGTGQLEGTSYESAMFEGYGPAGVAILMEVLTDNRNRTSNELRKLLERNNGSMASAGAVSYMFKRKGTIRVEKNGVTEEQLFNDVIDFDVEDIAEIDDCFEIICSSDKFTQVKEAVEKKYKVIMAETSLVPDTLITVDSAQAKKVMNLLTTLEDHDDIQNTYTNADFPEEFVKEASSE